MRRYACGLLLLASTASAQAPDAAKALAPDGVLRAAINFGNPVLAQRVPGDDTPHGVSPALAQALARQLGVPLRFVPFNEAGDVTRAATQDRWDVAFLAIDPQRSAGIDFTAPYVIIEGSYVVPSGSALRTTGAVDATGIRIAVAEGSAYDLFLSRSIRHATLLRFHDTAAAVAAFEAGRADALAGVRQPLEELVAATLDLRLLPGHFMVIEQAMGLPKAHAAGLPVLARFVEAMKASGFVANALAASGQKAAEVAPPAR